MAKINSSASRGGAPDRSPVHLQQHLVAVRGRLLQIHDWQGRIALISEATVKHHDSAGRSWNWYYRGPKECVCQLENYMPPGIIARCGRDAPRSMTAS